MMPSKASLQIAVSLLAITPSVPAIATSYVCGTLAQRLIYADAVVCGETISVEKRTGRGARNVQTFTFRIDEVIKGAGLSAGDELTEDSLPFVSETGIPPIEWGRYVLFLRSSDGKLRSGPCGVQADEATLARLRRMALVDADPSAFLNSENPLDVEALLHVIRKQHFPSGGSILDSARDTAAGVSIARPVAIEFLLRQAAQRTGSLYELAIELLARFHPTEALEPLLAALTSNAHNIISHAADGLGWLGDDRAVLPLVARLHELRALGDTLVPTPETAWTPDGKPYTKTVMKPDKTHRNVAGHLIDSLGRLRDARAVEVLLVELESNWYRAAAQALNAIGDHAAVQPLLRTIWTRRIEPGVLDNFDDPRIVAEARARMYTDPSAPALLARHADLGSRDFMRRLIEQGHADGGQWAAATRDRASRAQLIRNLRVSELTAAAQFAFALGRLRAFDIIPELLCDEYRHHGTYAKWGFVAGLLIEDIRDPFDGSDPQVLDRVAPLVDEVADCEGWSNSEQALALDLARAFRIEIQRARLPMRPLHAGVWEAPDGLPNMPDPLDPDAFRQYLRIDPRRVYAAIESGPPHEKTTILHAIARCNATLPGEVATPLLLHPSFDVRMAAGGLVQREALTTEQLRRWALGGRYDATSAALRYVHQHPRAEYADVVADVFRSGGHLFDENLFKAIIVTRATACLDHLRSYLHRQHIDLRRRAAITLAFFGDDSGRKIMLRERARLSALGPSAALAHVKAGLHALVAAK